MRCRRMISITLAPVISCMKNVDRNQKKKWIQRNGKNCIVILFWLAVWEILARLVDNSILLVSPLKVASTLCKMIGTSQFVQSVLGSFLRIVMGASLGFAAGGLLALLSFRYKVIRTLFAPLITFMKSVPVASFAVLLLIWWGSSFLSVAICFIVVLPIIYINLLEGLESTEKELLEMARVFHVSNYGKYSMIYRPAVAPFLKSGLQLSLGMCWKSGVAAEVIGTPVHSIGGQMYLSKIYLDTAGVFAWTVTIIILSVCMEKAVLYLAEKWWNRPPHFRKKNSTKSQTDAVLTADTVEEIRLNRVSKWYGAKKVLNEVSTTYQPGKIYYLRSPSGSGKTTLLRVLCGLERPQEGTVEGVNRCSVVFQEDRLCMGYTAVQNVALVTGDEEEAEKSLKQILDESCLNQPCEQLSGGMKRRVALVRAMEAASDLVLLDEPFTGMDQETMEKAENYIRKRQRGRTVIIATHVDLGERVNGVSG